jgi:uncharacterized protein (DUF2147 family)
MKRLLAVAAFLLASSAAQAQYSFEYGGRTIRIDPDRGTVSIPGVYDNTGRKSKRARSDQDSARKQQQQAPQEAKVDPQAQPQPQQPPADAAATPAAPPPASANASPEPSASTANNAPANNAPADAAALSPPPPLPAAPLAPQETAAPNPPPPPATVAAVPPLPAPAQRPQAPAPVAGAAPRDPNSPLGVWLTEEKEGKVRIEQCGANLCGYSVDAKSNQNGEQVLINMKAARDLNKDLKWTGRILDPNTGSTYDSTIALKGAGTLRVQGCAFGGMFCGGQTWTRVD